MEQYLLQLPKRLAQEVRSAIASSDGGGVEMISGADNKHFTFVINGKQYDAKIAQLPSILETHKTYDGNFLYKSGEIGQIFVVTEKEEEKQLLEQTEELPNGLTPPNTNVLKRKYAKTRRYQPFPKPDVGRVEEDLVKMIQGGPYEEVREELVDFCDWMVDEEHPNGIVVTDEVELIRQHPEYLDLSSEPPTKQAKANDARFIPSSLNARSGINTPVATDFGSEVESHGGQESAQRSPALAPTQVPACPLMQMGTQPMRRMLTIWRMICSAVWKRRSRRRRHRKHQPQRVLHQQHLRRNPTWMTLRTISSRRRETDCRKQFATPSAIPMILRLK
ncbi:hypothetical protein PINS_up019084 [Pythium insidiosum]|nr:hypothetical protein PINS_up019084 [Pythium insidiosum]